MNETTVITKEEQEKLTPQQALQLLKEGNARFLANEFISRDHFEHIASTANGQHPFAAVLGCIDSRVPAEIVFDLGVGDIFSIRIAGNFVNTDILGSMEFACKVAGSKVILVLGHTSCGAVKGACDNVSLGNLTGMLANIKPSIEAITDVEGERNSSNPEYVQKVADKNVELSVQGILEGSEVLREMSDNGEIMVVGAMYDVSTGKVTFYE